MAKLKDVIPPDPELESLAELDKKLLVARDRIRLVARGETPDTDQKKSASCDRVESAG